MTPITVTTLRQPARPRAERLRNLGVLTSAPGGGSSTDTGSYVTHSELLATAEELRTAMQDYLPLAGGIMSGGVTWRSSGHNRVVVIDAGSVQVIGDWSSINFVNTAGARIRLETHSAGNRINITHRAAGATAWDADLTISGGTWHAQKSVSLGDGAKIVQGDATLYYDSALGAWVSDKPIISHGDLTAFAD